MQEVKELFCSCNIWEFDSNEDMISASRLLLKILIHLDLEQGVQKRPSFSGRAVSVTLHSAFIVGKQPAIDNTKWKSMAMFQ